MRGWRPELRLSVSNESVHAGIWTTHIKTISKLQLILLARLCKETLCGTSSPATRSSKSRQGCGRTVRSKQPADSKVGYGGYEQR